MDMDQYQRHLVWVTPRPLPSWLYDDSRLKPLGIPFDVLATGQVVVGVGRRGRQVTNRKS